MNHEKQHFFDQPKNIKLVLNIFYVCCALLVILDFVIKRKIYHSWENLWAFYPIYGFVGCVVLVFAASWMRTFLMRSEDYYDQLEGNDENLTQDNIKGDADVDA
jgi:protein-S-isoprenylcysteine O-methyltransferase Ste14